MELLEEAKLKIEEELYKLESNRPLLNDKGVGVCEGLIKAQHIIDNLIVQNQKVSK